MAIIHVGDIATCYKAIDWCNNNIPAKSWRLDSYYWPGAGFNFIIDDLEIATLFRLTWSNFS